MSTKIGGRDLVLREPNITQSPSKIPEANFLTWGPSHTKDKLVELVETSMYWLLIRHGLRAQSEYSSYKSRRRSNKWQNSFLDKLSVYELCRKLTNKRKNRLASGTKQAHMGHNYWYLYTGKVNLMRANLANFINLQIIMNYFGHFANVFHFSGSRFHFLLFQSLDPLSCLLLGPWIPLSQPPVAHPSKGNHLFFYSSFYSFAHPSNVFLMLNIVAGPKYCFN